MSRPSYLTEEQYTKCLLLNVMVHKSVHVPAYFITVRLGQTVGGTKVLRHTKDTVGVESWVKCHSVDEAIEAAASAEERGYSWR